MKKRVSKWMEDSKGTKWKIEVCINGVVIEDKELNGKGTIFIENKVWKEMLKFWVGPLLKNRDKNKDEDEDETDLVNPRGDK